MRELPGIGPAGSDGGLQSVGDAALGLTEQNGVKIDASGSVPGTEGTIVDPVKLVRKIAGAEQTRFHGSGSINTTTSTSYGGGFRPVECEQIVTWYPEQHAYLLLAMDAVDMGGHTLLNKSVVFFGSELGDPPTHEMDNMPFLLAGGGGGLRGGRYLHNQDASPKRT